MIIGTQFKSELKNNVVQAREIANKLQMILSVIDEAENNKRDISEKEKQYILPKIDEVEIAINNLKQLNVKS